MRFIKIKREVYNRIIDHSLRGFPEEACGLLLSNEEGIVDIIEVRNATTQNRRTTYLINPLDLLAADDSAEERGLQVIGNYHSHPAHSARPSETDTKSAVQNWIYIIVAVKGVISGEPEMKIWKLENKKFVEELLEIE